MTCKLDTLELSIVVSEELDIVAVCELHPVAGLDGSRVAGPVLLFLKFCLETLDVDLISLLRSDELGKVDRESECIIKNERILT